jgi:hypothetical protein
LRYNTSYKLQPFCLTHSFTLKGWVSENEFWLYCVLNIWGGGSRVVGAWKEVIQDFLLFSYSFEPSDKINGWDCLNIEIKVGQFFIIGQFKINSWELLKIYTYYRVKML